MFILENINWLNQHELNIMQMNANKILSVKKYFSVHDRQFSFKTNVIAVRLCDLLTYVQTCLFIVKRLS